MTKEEALYKFWSSFGWTAYEESSVPTSPENRPKLPYITYQVVTDSFGGNVMITASLWDKKTPGHSATQEINKKSSQISDYIGMGGTFVPYADGAIWIRRATPFAQSMGDESDDTIRRKLINITAEFISAN